MQATNKQTPEAPEARQDDVTRELLQGLEEVRGIVAACMQCGTCTASCPNAHAMDMTPRQMWRLAHLGLLEDIFASKSFQCCSDCYTCQLRCPRELELTEAMHVLKRIFTIKELRDGGSDTLFCRLFLENARRHGRVHEGTLMMRYFVAKRDPRLPLGYTSLGLRMLGKGKLHFGGHSRSGGLESLFSKVASMEGRS